MSQSVSKQERVDGNDAAWKMHDPWATNSGFNMMDQTSESLHLREATGLLWEEQFEATKKRKRADDEEEEEVVAAEMSSAERVAQDMKKQIPPKRRRIHSKKKNKKKKKKNDKEEEEEDKTSISVKDSSDGNESEDVVPEPHRTTHGFSTEDKFVVNDDDPPKPMLNHEDNLNWLEQAYRDQSGEDQKEEEKEEKKEKKKKQQVNEKQPRAMESMLPGKKPIKKKSDKKSREKKKTPPPKTAKSSKQIGQVARNKLFKDVLKSLCYNEIRMKKNAKPDIMQLFGKSQKALHVITMTYILMSSINAPALQKALTPVMAHIFDFTDADVLKGQIKDWLREYQPVLSALLADTLLTVADLRALPDDSDGDDEDDDDDDDDDE